MFQPTVWKVRVTFEEDMLGGVPASKQIYTDHVMSKARDLADSGDISDELDTLPDDTDFERGKTTFHRLDDGTPIIYDYVVKGFMKDVCSMLAHGGERNRPRSVPSKRSLTAWSSSCPGRIKIDMNGEMREMQRPLRADTPQGPGLHSPTQTWCQPVRLSSLRFIASGQRT
jgi:hypothetical protein